MERLSTENYCMTVVSCVKPPAVTVTCAVAMFHLVVVQLGWSFAKLRGNVELFNYEAPAAETKDYITG
ncbi:MAG: hypothetical protein ACR2IE_14410 [Candidatus Sumerlaeaceae bacterium]